MRVPMRSASTFAIATFVTATVALATVAAVPASAGAKAQRVAPGEARSAAPHAAHRGAAACRVLRTTRSLRRTLRRVHVRSVRRGARGKAVRVRGPLGRVYHGRCGTTRYAVATFSQRIGGTDFGTQDQPERFRRRAGRRWRDLGDTGGMVCGTMPRSLLSRWGFDCRRQPSATAARKSCGRVRHRGNANRVVVARGRVSCRGARRVVRRWLRAVPPPGWRCYLAHGPDITYGAVCAPGGVDPDVARRRILGY